MVSYSRCLLILQARYDIPPAVYPGTMGSTQPHDFNVPPHALTQPLPGHDNDELDLPTGVDILRAAGQRPAAKKAGARRSDPTPGKSEKAKGKQRDVSPQPRGPKRKPSSTVLGASEPKKQKGRSSGSSNFRDEDLEALHDILEELLPIGGKGWMEVEDQFNQWAGENGRPSRTAKSLEAKYKQVCTVHFMGLKYANRYDF